MYFIGGTAFILPSAYNSGRRTCYIFSPEMLIIKNGTIIIYNFGLFLFHFNLCVKWEIGEFKLTKVLCIKSKWRNVL